MTDQPNGGQAFPGKVEYYERGEDISYHTPGMTLRDYFAAHALAIAWHSEGIHPLSDIANVAYQLADEMLREREKTSDKNAEHA